MKKTHHLEKKIEHEDVFQDYLSRLGHRISGVRTIKKLTQ